MNNSIKLIKIQIDNPSAEFRFRDDKQLEDIVIDTKLENWKYDIRSDSQYIRGIVRFKPKNGKQIELSTRDCRYEFSDRGDFDEIILKDHEMMADEVCGVFRYVRSIAAIDIFGFNQWDRFMKIKGNYKKVHENVSVIIQNQLRREEFERQKLRLESMKQKKIELLILKFTGYGNVYILNNIFGLVLIHITEQCINGKNDSF